MPSSPQGIPRGISFPNALQAVEGQPEILKDNVSADAHRSPDAVRFGAAISRNRARDVNMTKRNQSSSSVSYLRRSSCCLSWLCLGAELTASAATPTIEFQPKDQTVILYQPAAFGIIANRGESRWISDGKMLVAGNLSARVSGYQAELKRLNPDGSADETFHVEVNLGGSIRSLVVQRDGRIVMGGYFSKVNGLPQAGIARLWPDSEVPPTITRIERKAHRMALEWTTIPRRAYRVQSRDGITGSSWVDLPGDTTATGGKAHRTEDGFVQSGQRSYRVLLLGH